MKTKKAPRRLHLTKEDLARVGGADLFEYTSMPGTELIAFGLVTFSNVRKILSPL